MSGFTLRRRLHGPTDVKLMPRKASLAHKETYKERRQEILLTFRREGKLGVVIRLHTQFFRCHIIQININLKINIKR